jgi:putative ABC transport system permease protein
MKSMGASRYDNFVIYAGIAFVYGLIAVIPAVILGIPAGNAASHALAPELNTVIDGFKISPGSIILGILVGLLIPVLSSLIPVYFGTRVQILDAMTDLGIDANYGSGPIARLINILPVPITVRQGFSNVSLKKSRLVFTVITLAIAAGAFMGIFAVFSSLTGGINTFLDTFNVEVAIFPNQGRDPDEITTLLVDNFASGDDAILNSVEPGFQLQVEFEGYDPPATAGGPPGIFAYGYDITSENPSFVFTVDEGEPLTEENAADGIIFSSLLAQNMDRNVGDRVVLKVPGNSAELTIVGISDFVLDQVWLDWRTLALISGSTFSEPVESRFPIPDDAAAFIQYAAPVAIGQDEAVALALTPQAASFLASFITDGEMYSAGAPGVILSSELADANSYDIGDALILKSTAEDGGSGDYTVTGIIELPAQFQGEDLPSNFVAMSWENLATLDGLSLEGKPRPQGFFITTTLDDPSATELDGVIDDLNEVMLENGIPVSAFNFVELTDQISAAFTTIQVILQAVASLIALVGALGLLTTLSMSVFERQKEIGVMRSIGASSGTVVTQFLTEGLVVGIIAWIVGLPLAYLIEVGLLSVTGFDETFPAVFPVSAAIIGLVGMLLITALASLWPSLSAARKTVSDILRYQ